MMCDKRADNVHTEHHSMWALKGSLHAALLRPREEHLKISLARATGEGEDFVSRDVYVYLTDDFPLRRGNCSKGWSWSRKELPAMCTFADALSKHGTFASTAIECSEGAMRCEKEKMQPHYLVPRYLL
ncbi:hypothetical protein PMIN04_013249 [Paraphaeosphaeria minitans]